jgi:predicted RNase H-like nuclease
MGSGLTEVWEPCTFAELYEQRGLDLIVIDIPIGLPDKGPRQADEDARKFLGKRRSTVFPAPLRPILKCDSWEDACLKRTEIDGKRISKQQFGILSKVREVDTALRCIAGARVYEGHPEVSFAKMNKDSPLPVGKKKKEGRSRRTELICKHFQDATVRLEESPHHREDVLDAYALLWTARRILEGKSNWFPEQDACDRFGLPMRISA